MKTIREWLEQLPEPYRSQAITNTNTLNGGLLYAEDDSCNGDTMGLPGVLKEGFIWELSPESHAYWSKLCNSIELQQNAPGNDPGNK